MLRGLGMKNLLVMYKGGVYAGCVWEWNFCFWDDNGEWHDLYSSGRDGIETEDKTIEALAEDDSRINYVVNLTNEEDIAYWQKEFNAYLVHNIADKINTNYYGVIKLQCNECSCSYYPDDMQYVDKYTLVCGECVSLGSCVACDEFVGGDNLHILPECLYDEGPVCEFCKDHFESEAIADDVKELQFTATLTGKPDIFSPEYQEVISKIETQFETCFNDYRNEINY